MALVAVNGWMVLTVCDGQPALRLPALGALPDRRSFSMLPDRQFVLARCLQTTPGTTPPTSSPAKAALRQLQQPQEQQKSQALKTGPAADGSGGGNKGGGRRGALDAFMRTAGLAGVVGAVAIQLLQHIRPH